ncbi:FAD/NAD(P)-binding protein [Nonomuraea sp. NPDC048901]|uniref:FAD/NAD(P)-binding protein n=1 Tax=Nonomuraea sp. NPDC048901 TaxID=3155627 RepID=UPI0033C74B44
MKEGVGGALVIAIVGAGPAGTIMLERLVANCGVLGPRLLEVHLIDPHPPGGGRVWRRDQPELLWMNSTADDVTMFTDDSVRMAGPIRHGPSLREWSSELRPGSFATRRQLNDYLSWCFTHIVESAPLGVTVRAHRGQVVDLTERAGRQHVWVAGRAGPIEADAVVLTQGHLDAESGQEHQELAAYAATHGLTYLPPHYAADTDLSILAPGEPVVMRGMGLGFIDDMVLLTEGRGGRFGPGYDYRPTGHEPIMYVTSRRGVPNHSKITVKLRGGQSAGARYLTPEALTALHDERGPLSLRDDLGPLIIKELGWHYYHELFNGHPDRVTMSWSDFQRHYDADGAARPLIEAAVIKQEDRFDLDRMLDPLAGRSFGSLDELGAWTQRYIIGDVRRHADPEHSADLGLCHGMLSVFGALGFALATGRLSARARAVELGDWAQSVFSFYASGPPPRRLLELAGLARAGVIRFLGATGTVTAADGVFRATSASVPGVVIETRALVESRLPETSLRRTRDPLLRALHARGDVTEESLTADGTVYRLGRVAVDAHRLVTRDGVHSRRFALGHGVGGGFTPVGFTRPHANSIAFRNADALARRLLTEIEAGTP